MLSQVFFLVQLTSLHCLSLSLPHTSKTDSKTLTPEHKHPPSSPPPTGNPQEFDFDFFLSCRLEPFITLQQSTNKSPTWKVRYSFFQTQPIKLQALGIPLSEADQGIQNFSKFSFSSSRFCSEVCKAFDVRIFSGSKQDDIITMALKFSLVLVLLVICSCTVEVISRNNNLNRLKKNDSSLAAIKMPDHSSFNTVSSPANNDCSFSNSEKFGHSGVTTSDEDTVDGYVATPHKQLLKLDLKRRSVTVSEDAEPKKPVIDFTIRDLTRIQTLHRRVIEKKNQDTFSRLKKTQLKSNQIKAVTPAPAAVPEYFKNGYPGRLVATLESGASLGSGEYFMDVFVGTPPKHFSLILDTGSDLNWIQCVPCYVCFEQSGPHYDPKDSSSFKNISCHDKRCLLVSSPDPPHACKNENQSCPYFYWYGDSSNTTGDFALETFTVNLTTSTGKSEFRRVENVMFGCGHWNRGLFHGAAGLLGLGRGPLSFASQLQSLYGHSFSYCLVDRNSNVSSKLIFGEDRKLLSNPNLNFTSFVSGKENPVDTFYYVQIKSVMVGGEVLKIPKETWLVSSEEEGVGGGGGTIIDSGTTLTYFAEPAYEIIKEAFMKKIKGYHMVEEEGPVPLKPCYNVSGFEAIELPDFGILFEDGAVWDFPVENYFIEIEPGGVVCLAILGTPHSALSIIGNYQQQNFHILYDLKNSRLGYAPVNCADA